MNQRIIKYRAWDTIDCEWKYSGYPNMPMSQFWQNVEDGIYINVCEFTGLHDKNGKEIWEGDIVDTDTDKGMQVHIGGYWETVGGNGNGVHISNKNETRVFGVSPFNQDNAIEVIGNIYENPELLK
jgi:uncharacterized phage protein (TIGR01671 family)